MKTKTLSFLEEFTMKTKTLSFLAMAVLAVVGCSKSSASSGGILSEFYSASDLKKMERYTKADWLHDIDEAKRILARGEDVKSRFDYALKSGNYSSKEYFQWQVLMTPIIKAMREVSMRFTQYTARACWPEGKWEVVVTTANTDHDCLNKRGYPRSR
ncbi:MAG: hypothetical protein LBI31_02695 [Zoogloeaceae bacterium]|jgi:hypothetical protein|nr:hypothetical protein [Zoogloeaceae bacterium]